MRRPYDTTTREKEAIYQLSLYLTRLSQNHLQQRGITFHDRHSENYFSEQLKKKQNIPELLAYFQKTGIERWSFASTWAKLALHLFELEQTDLTRKTYTYALKLFPTDDFLNASYLSFLRIQGRSNECEQRASMLIENYTISNKIPDVYQEAIKSAGYFKKFHMADYYYVKACQYFPTAIPIHLQMIEVNYQRGNFNAMRKIFIDYKLHFDTSACNRFISLCSDFVDTALALDKMDDKQAILSTLQDLYWNKLPNTMDAESAVRLIDIFGRLGESEFAKSVFIAFNRTSYYLLPLYNAIINACYLNNDRQTAKKHYADIKKGNPNDFHGYSFCTALLAFQDLLSKNNRPQEIIVGQNDGCSILRLAVTYICRFNKIPYAVLEDNPGVIRLGHEKPIEKTNLPPITRHELAQLKYKLPNYEACTSYINLLVKFYTPHKKIKLKIKAPKEKERFPEAIPKTRFYLLENEKTIDKGSVYRGISSLWQTTPRERKQLTRTEQKQHNKKISVKQRQEKEERGIEKLAQLIEQGKMLPQVKPTNNQAASLFTHISRFINTASSKTNGMFFLALIVISYAILTRMQSSTEHTQSESELTGSNPNTYSNTP